MTSGVQGAGWRVEGAACRVEGAKCRVEGGGFRERVQEDRSAPDTRATTGVPRSQEMHPPQAHQRALVIRLM